MAAVTGTGTVPPRHPSPFRKAQKISRPSATATAHISSSGGSDPYHGHENTAKLCARFISHLFSCPDDPPPALHSILPNTHYDQQSLSQHGVPTVPSWTESKHRHERQSSHGHPPPTASFSESHRFYQAERSDASSSSSSSSISSQFRGQPHSGGGYTATDAQLEHQDWNAAGHDEHDCGPRGPLGNLPLFHSTGKPAGSRLIGTGWPQNISKSNPTLSSWLNNMNKLSSLIHRLQELASATRLDRRRKLYKQVAALRTAFEMQQKRYSDFLRLTEEYADRYLLDISAEIEQQSSFLDMLANRLDMANKLYSQAVKLRKSYESGTVDAMKSVRETALKQPLPAESDLFRQIDFVLDEISRCYRELDKFWTDEVCRAVTALRTRRVDPGDVERWRGFKASLQQITESWNITINTQGDSIWNVLHDNHSGSSSGDLGAIASSLFPALNTLRGWLQRIHESASVEYSNMCLTPILRAELGLGQNNNRCFTFFRRCVEFGEMITATSTALIGSATFSRVKDSDDLLERAMSFGTDAPDVSAENDTLPQDHSSGSWKFNYLYKQALSRQRKMALGMNILVEIVSSWIMVADTLPDALPVGFSLKRLRNMADAWEKERASMRRVLGALTDDPAERLRYRCLSSTRPRSCMARWMTNLVGFVRSSVTS